MIYNQELGKRTEEAIRSLCMRAYLPIGRRTSTVILLQDLLRRVAVQQREIDELRRGEGNAE